MADYVKQVINDNISRDSMYIRESLEELASTSSDMREFIIMALDTGPARKIIKDMMKAIGYSGMYHTLVVKQFVSDWVYGVCEFDFVVKGMTMCVWKDSEHTATPLRVCRAIRQMMCLFEKTYGGVYNFEVSVVHERITI